MHICVRAKVAESFIPIVLCCWVIWGAQNQHKMLCVFALQWIPFFGVNSGEGVSHCLSLYCRWKLFQNVLLNLLILCFFLHLCTLLRARCNITLLLPWTPPTQIQPRVVKSKPSQSFANSLPFKCFNHQQQTTPWRPQQRQKIALDCFSRQVCQSASLNAAHAGPDQVQTPLGPFSTHHLFVPSKEK